MLSPVSYTHLDVYKRQPSPTIPVVAIPGDDDFLTHLPKSGDEDFAAKYNIVYNRNGHKCAYLTFDDGPSQLTPKILDLLKKYDIKATFFVVGSLAEKNPDIVKRASDEGHMKMCIRDRLRTKSI